MTSIAWDNGPIFRNGAVGTEQACCCGFVCNPCNDCSWPADRSEFGEETLECAGSQGSPSSRGQNIYPTANSPSLPSGVTWKSGFPDKLFLCNWALVVDSLFIDCCYDNCTVNGVPGSFLLAGKTKTRYRIMLMNCPTETTPGYISDITADAIEGDLQPEVNQADGFNCIGDPIDCTDWFEFYDDPVPDCNEFP